MEFLNDTAIWLLGSFLIFAFLVFKFGKDALLGILDNHIKTIKDDIKTAENLRVEAQELLAQYQRKHRDAVAEAEGIIKTAQQHAAEINRKAEEDLSETIARREKQLKERLNRMEASAIDEIQAYAANLAIEATAEIIVDKLDKKTGEALVKQSITDLGQKLH